MLLLESLAEIVSPCKEEIALLDPEQVSPVPAVVDCSDSGYFVAELELEALVQFE